MTVSSWFRSGPESVSLKETLKHLHPPRHVPNEDRFSQLLLEHGEKCLQDWAVVAFSSPVQTENDVVTQPPRSSKIQWEQAPTSASNRPRSSTTTTQQRRQHSHSHSHSHSQPSLVATTKVSCPTAHMTNIQGRLHLCSRSLVFEPNETTRAIVRCPFGRMDASPHEFPPPDEAFEAMCIQFTSQRHTIMKVNNIVGPFQPQTQVVVQFRFTFLHSSPTDFLILCKQLFELAVSSNHRHSTTTTPELDALLKPLVDRPFSPDNLLDVREPILTSSLKCSILTPLQTKSGVVVVTTEHLYFQQAAQPRALRWLLRTVAATARRYKGLRDSALEIYWNDRTSTLLAFERRHDREQVLRLLPHNVLCFTDRDFVMQVVHQWQNGTLDNFEYLLALNSAAGRSFQDLSRYPVFPWVLADYTSSKLDLSNETMFRDLTKPVGALNAKRLDYFRTRLESMQDMGEDFLYGTHYSAPGYVLYYLVRSMPEHMLCLQNGKYDAPDRMFHSIAQCYRCALTNHADVKELIPEFFDPTDFDFLLNARGLQLGATQNGDRVNDVALPPWARSAREFVKKNRKALESDICTRKLPQWIDLVFGCKSRGAAAKEACNLFHRCTYMGPSDLASMQAAGDRIQAEFQATEFGIVPDMLFVGPHPLKEDPLQEDFVSLEIGRASSKEDSREAWELLDPPSSQEGMVQTTTLRSEETPEMEDTMFAKTSQEDAGWSSSMEQSTMRPEESSNFTTSPRGETGNSGPFSSPQRSVGSQRSPAKLSPQDVSPQIQQFPEGASAYQWDMNIIERRSIHSDAVSGCVLLLRDAESMQSILVTTSLDGGLKVHNVSLETKTVDEEDKGGFSSTLSRFSYSTIMSRGQVSQASSQSKFTEYRSHSSRDPLASLVLALDGAGGSVAFAGGHDDVVLAYGINSACAVASVYSHRDAVTGLDLIPRSAFDAGSALWLENSTHIMISGSWDATVKLWSASVAGGETVSVNREALAELFDADSSIVCVSAKSIPTGGIIIGAGCADGSFCVWNVHNDGAQVVIHNEPARRGAGPCSVVQWISAGGSLHMFAAFSSGRVASYTLVDGRVLERRNAVSVGVAVLSLVYSDGFLLVGCADGGLRLIPVREGAYFDSKPTLWNAVNNKSSPGISSISVTYTGAANNNEPGKCLCCTGGEDGSIALFELKRA
jgi:factor associated with neutral sphingomyelinase activation